MIFHTIMNHLKMTVAGVGILMLTSCNGIFDDIYDQPKEIVPAKGQLLIDATSWTDWYYVDLNLLQRLTEAGDEEALMKAQTEFAAYPIPMTATGEKDESEAGHEAATQGRKAGQYMYWFDVFGEGYQKNSFSYYTPTEGQEEPEEWTLAVHRNNVRTNGGAVLETSYTSMDELPESSEAFRNMMLMGYVPSQGICVNKVLSSWLSMKIPPMPPAFSLNNHVFILRLKDGTYAALQLENYLSQEGKKCFLTINYKYPY